MAGLQVLADSLRTGGTQSPQGPGRGLLQRWTHGGPPPRREAHGHGSPLCQDAVGSEVLGLVVTGPGSGLSEEPVWGREPAALESESLPRCPPGPVTACVIASSSRWRKTMSESRRFRARMASIEVFPSALRRS